ncbi:MAG: hypothetical protein WC606_02910 [Candidatus Absconditabacterales bacterium]|jgi:hypothetical protein
METLDFKNLDKEQEEELNKLLATMMDATKASINGISVPLDMVSVCTSEGDISLTQMKKEIESLSPIGIDHMRMYFTTLETIARIKLKKTKKTIGSLFKF